MTCEQQLKDIDFTGGTFVEYLDGYGTQKEFGRGVIAKLLCKGDSISVETEKSIVAEWKLGIPHVYSSGCTVWKQGDFWLIETGTYCGFMCAIAPEGVEIPDPKNYSARMHK